MSHISSFAPRSLPNRKRFTVELSPYELYQLITVLERDALDAIANDDHCPLCEWAADARMQRVAELRELAR
jgi:hypothetical protein